MTEYDSNQYGGTPPASGAPQAPAGYQAAHQADTGAGGYGASGQTAQFGYANGTAAGSDAASGGSASPGGFQPSDPGKRPSDGKKQGGAKTFLMGFAGAAVACALALGGFAVWQNASDGGSSTQLGGSGSTVIDVDGEDATLAEAVAAKCLPSVAAIDVYTEQSGSYGMFGMYGYGDSGSGELTETSLGSGVVISEDGYIITNNHVVEGADAVRVTVDGQEYEADVIGTDPSSDLAVVKAKDASGLTAVDLGDSDNLTIGEWVMSIGSPFGLEQSVATGIVSATNRSQIMDSSTDSYGQSETT